MRPGVNEREGDDRELEIVRIGIEAENFLASALGTYMVEKADKLAEEATIKLILCKPDDVRGNTNLRNDIAVATYFKSWIESVISDGYVAERTINEQDDLASE